MNCLIFQTTAEARQLPSHDHRVKHLVKVLRLKAGDRFDGALLGQYLGRYEFKGVAEGWAQFELIEQLPSPALALPGVELAIGYCRPLILKRVFRDGAAMGLKAFEVFATDLGDPSYEKSGYLGESRYLEQFVAGLEQSGDFRLPTLTRCAGLEKLLEQRVEGGESIRTIVLDRINTYHNQSERSNPYLSDWLAALARPVPLRLIVGSERGFSLREKRLIENAHHVVSCKLGPQMVRADTAALAALSSVWQRFAALTGS